MDSDDLEKALLRLAAQRKPVPSGNLEQNVWREIRSRKSVRVRESIWNKLAEKFLRPKWTLASASVVAAFISVGMVASEGPSSAATTHSSLGLGVFSTEAPVLPSTLLTHVR
jgi:hypothetical protein